MDTAPSTGTHALLRFGAFEMNLDTQELRKFGTVVKLPPQPFRLLQLLANHAGQIVTREEIQKQLWGEETYVDFEHGMNKCIKQIRTALSDNADNPVYVETIPRHGYRFLVPVTTKTVLAPAPKVKESSSGIPADVAAMIRARLSEKKTNLVLLKLDPPSPGGLGQPDGILRIAGQKHRTPWWYWAVGVLVLVVLIGALVYWRL